MPTPTFDLIDVIKTIQKQKRTILLITLACMACGAIMVGVKKKKYKATTRFFVNNPLYGDRSTLFRNVEQRYVDYFGGDDDIDRVTALLSSDTVVDKIIRRCEFDKIYKLDINTPKGNQELKNIFNKNFKLKRSEYKDIEVSFVAYEPATAATIANTTVATVEESFRAYYTNMKMSMYQSIADKVKEMDSAINIYSDSLANMRDRYGIYSIISPARANVIVSDVKPGKGLGKGIEQIQNIESIKDQLVTDRAKYYSLLNEFSTTTNSNMSYIKVTTRALPPVSPSGISLPIMAAIGAFLGLFFSTTLVVLLAYYKLLNAVVR
jgi:uncharacterized protein involved in exopolysaccharide biosynthesis